MTKRIDFAQGGYIPEPPQKLRKKINWADVAMWIFFGVPCLVLMASIIIWGTIWVWQQILSTI